MESVVKVGCALSRSLIQIVAKRRTEKVLQELEAQGITLVQARAKDPAYLGCLLRTMEALERSSRSEKLNMIVSFFTTCDASNFIQEQPDFYQEMLSLIDEMSYREMQILFHLDQAGLPFYDDKEVINPNDENNASAKFATAIEITSKKMSLNKDMLIALLVRLNRTGLLANTATWESTIYFFSPLYRDLKKFISIEYYELQNSF